MSTLAKMAPWFAKTLIEKWEKHGVPLDRESVMGWLDSPNGREYMAAELRTKGLVAEQTPDGGLKFHPGGVEEDALTRAGLRRRRRRRRWKTFDEVERERDEADDEQAKDDNFARMADDDGDDERDDGENGDDVISRAVRAHGGKITAAEALTWLRSDTVGREFARAHKQENPMDTGQKLAAFAKRSGGVMELAGEIVEKGLPSTMASEQEFTKLMTAHACKLYPSMRPDVAFAKLYADERVLREAHAIVKAIPTEMVITPMFVGGAEARDVNDPKSAMEQLNALVEEQRKRAPFMSAAQAFAAVYKDNPKLAALERVQNRPKPGDHPSYR